MKRYRIGRKCIIEKLFTVFFPFALILAAFIILSGIVGSLIHLPAFPFLFI
ncbi:hypothetical protein OYT88_03185 [Sporolactobacillus sp. CQH2019]|uniref:hypothetical protein n=1 Tax=Sporolactobacillus sp. CQH2019 TaxID=3023512 RepID=UPI00236766F0|nr:hypothetical protein [Sporolactobacillus sp. CQH2019]MDD9147557.1 hypothetical protein [Sporolactobacillus sp. CQH2019]